MTDTLIWRVNLMAVLHEEGAWRLNCHTQWLVAAPTAARAEAAARLRTYTRVVTSHGRNPTTIYVNDGPELVARIKPQRKEKR